MVKTIKFKNPNYIGDPINSVRIFNEKEVDELIFLDINASKEGHDPDFKMLEDIAGEAFMPMAYGGGITKLEQIKRIFSLGFEKIIISTATYTSPQLISDAVAIYGSQSIVACLDVRRTFLGHYELTSHAGRTKKHVELKEHILAVEGLGVGEIIVNTMDRDGTQSGYDLKLLKQVSSSATVPVVACGGASKLDDFVSAVEQGGVSAVAAGSLFVYVGPHRAVLINYPDRKELTKRLP